MSTKDGNEFLRTVRKRVPLVLTVFSISCNGDGQAARPPSRSIAADLIVSVNNGASHPTVIYVGAGAMRDSLGVVPARAIKSFSVPSEVGRSTTSIRLEARDRTGATSALSVPFDPSPGHQIIWTLDHSRNGAVTIR